MKLVARVPKKDVEESGLLRVKYPPYDVLVTMVDGEPCAIEDACNHAGASLSEGSRVEGGACVSCPMHGYVFELRTGKLVAPTGLCDDQRRYEATLEGDDIAVWDTMDVVILS